MPISAATVRHSLASQVSGRSVRAMTSAGAARSPSRSARAAARSRSVSEYSRSAGTPVTSLDGLTSARQVLPRNVRVRAGLGREAQHALGDDGAKDLRRPALDRVALGPQGPVARAAGQVSRPGPAHPPIVVGEALLTQELHLEPGNLLVEPRERQLRGRP